MRCMHNRLWSWHIAAMIFIFIGGSIWHFVFVWSGNSAWLAPISPVNESVWEHFKLAPIPSLIFSGLMFLKVGRYHPNFLVARAVALYVAPLLIGGLHYAYRLPLGHPLLAADISIFAIAIILAEASSWYIIQSPPTKPTWAATAIWAAILLLWLFGFLTYDPPHWPIFLDTSTGQYGLKALRP